MTMNTQDLLAALEDPEVIALVERHLGRPEVADLDTTLERYQRFGQQLRANRFVMPFAGMQGSGKSTLLNALLFDEPILPVDADETTCVPVEIRWGDSAAVRARVIFVDGREECVAANEEALSAWVHNERNPGNRDQVARVVIEVRHELLAGGLVLVDLPGTGSLTAANQATTLGFLEEAVGVVFVLRTVPPLTRSESLFVALQWSRLRSALFLQNRWTDESNTEAQEGHEHNVTVLQDLARRHRIPQASDGPEVDVVNGHLAFKAALTSDAQLLRESGLIGFRERLAAMATQWRETLAASVRSALLTDLGDVVASCERQIKHLQRSSAELDADMREERERFAGYIAQVSERRAAASARLASFRTELDEHVRGWAKAQTRELRGRMRAKFKAGIVDGPRLDEALRQEQRAAADELIERAQELVTTAIDDLRCAFAEMPPWSCDRGFSAHGFDSKEKRKWESVAEPTVSAAGGVIGTALGTPMGPWGMMLFGLLGAYIGSKAGEMTRQQVLEWRAKQVEPQVFDLIDRFVSSHSERLLADAARMVEQTTVELDRWTAQRKAEFERSQVASEAVKRATQTGRGDLAKRAASDLKLSRLVQRRLSGKSVVETIISWLDAWELEAWAASARHLQERLQSPRAYLTVLGETSAGKSTLINGLFNRPVLPFAASPTTSQLVQVSCEESPEAHYAALQRDGTARQLDRSEFELLAHSSRPEVQRLLVRARPIRDSHVGLQVFDTAGYNATIDEHEEILREFVPNSDALVYVVGYRTGFGQADEAMLEWIVRATADDPEMPVFLVVNRCPRDTDVHTKRVQEIAQHAREGFGRDLAVLLVHSSSPDIPDSSALWSLASQRINGDERHRALQEKLRGVLRKVFLDADAELERRMLKAVDDVATRRAVAEAAEEMVRARDVSFEEVARTIERLRTLIPKACKKSAESLAATLDTEIERSDKWLGYEYCSGWLSGHALPFGVREIARELEKLIAIELERLDEELAALANTAVGKVKEDTRPISVDGAAFRANITRAVAERVAGGAVQSVLRSFGGVGGPAAGAGNLAKMAVSRAGRLFGRRFSRAVYNRIGSTFTNRALKRINVLAAAMVDGLVYLRHVATWRDEVKKMTRANLEVWVNAVTADFLDDELPEIERANRAAVDAIYADLVDFDAERTPAKDEFELLRSRRNLLREQLQLLEDDDE